MSGEARAVLLTGGLGAGKTALAQEAFAVLAEAGHTAVVIDLDRLVWARPDPRTGVTTASLLDATLRALRPVYGSAGIRFYVLARAVVHRDDVDSVRAALDVPLAVVRVTCPPVLAEARVRARDVGAELEENLAELERFEAGVGEDFAVENGDRPLRGVALELLDRLGWTTMAP